MREKPPNSLARCLFIAVLTLFSTPAWAGMDDTQTIAQTTGMVEVRGAVIRADKHRTFNDWAVAKAGDEIGPGCSVRTGAQSTVRLRRGDRFYHARKGDSVSYTLLQPRTRILLHGNHSNKKLIELLQGKIVREEKRL